MSILKQKYLRFINFNFNLFRFLLILFCFKISLSMERTIKSHDVNELDSLTKRNSDSFDDAESSSEQEQNLDLLDDRKQIEEYKDMDKLKQIVRESISKPDQDINQKDEDGETILTLSCQLGWDDIVCDLLTKEDLDINFKNGNGNTALMEAITNERIEVVKILLKAELDINSVNYNGDNALFLAIEKGNEEILDFILEYEGLDFNSKNKYGQTALMFTVINNKNNSYQNLIVKLLNGLCDINAKDKAGNTALIYAARLQQYDLVDLFLRRSELLLNHVNNLGNSALLEAIIHNHNDIALMLLGKKGIKIKLVNKNRDNPLSLAIGNGNYFLVYALIESFNYSEDEIEKGLSDSILINNFQIFEFLYVFLKSKNSNLDPKISTLIKAWSCNNTKIANLVFMDIEPENLTEAVFKILINFINNNRKDLAESFFNNFNLVIKLKNLDKDNLYKKLLDALIKENFE